MRKLLLTSAVGLFCGLIVVEAAYMVASRMAVARLGYSVESELWRTGIRLVAALGLFGLLRLTKFPALAGKPMRVPEDRWLTILAITCAMVAVAVPMTLRAPTFEQWVFIATSVVVGLHEELLFRRILLTWFYERFGLKPALLIVGLLFCTFHIGLTQSNVLNYAQIFLAGTLFGTVYLATRNLWLLVGLHAGYDMLHVLIYAPAMWLIGIQLGLLLLGALLGGAALARRGGALSASDSGYPSAALEPAAVAVTLSK